MAKIGKKRSNPNSVEAYACYCSCTCTGCNCSAVCPVGGGGITSSELIFQVFARASDYNAQNALDNVGFGNYIK